MMGLSADFRRKAAEQREATAPLYTTEKLVDPKNRIVVTVGQCNSTMYDALADVVDYLDGQQKLSKLAETLKQRMELTHAIRTAAATQDWDKFAELVAGLAGGGADAGGGAPGGHST